MPILENESGGFFSTLHVKQKKPGKSIAFHNALKRSVLHSNVSTLAQNSQTQNNALLMRSMRNSI